MPTHLRGPLPPLDAPRVTLVFLNLCERPLLQPGVTCVLKPVQAPTPLQPGKAQIVIRPLPSSSEGDQFQAEPWCQRKHEREDARVWADQTGQEASRLEENSHMIDIVWFRLVV